MNGDLISRSALLDAMCKTCTMQEVCEKSYNETRDFIQAIPAVDAEPVRHGRWIGDEDFMGDILHRCSVCGEMAIYYNNHYGGVTSEPTDYCPSCGAKMDGEAQ